MPGANLDGVRVVELADEQAEYAGLLLAGLGADVVKVEPPGGAPTRAIGPFAGDRRDPEGSLHFWHYNRQKRSVVLDPDRPDDRDRLEDLLATADVLLESTPRGQMEGWGLGPHDLAARYPALVAARVTPFGDDGPWADFRGSDLVHLALGGPVMNCGYDPRPDGTYDLPPVAPQLWHASHIVGDQVAMMVVAALWYRRHSGRGQRLTCAVHEAVAKCTEMDLMSWVMRAAPLRRQTCRHAAEVVSAVPTIAQTKDGRWVMFHMGERYDGGALAGFLERYGMAAEPPAPGGDPSRPAAGAGQRSIPGTSVQSEAAAGAQDLVARLVRKFRYQEVPWLEAQRAGLLAAPLRKPHENALDGHWAARGTFADVHHPERGRTYPYVASKWVSASAPWVVGRRAPLLGEDGEEILAACKGARHAAAAPPAAPARPAPPPVPDPPAAGAPPVTRPPFALEGVRVLDFTWFLASAGGTRFLAALGAECVKVEWHAHPDTRMGAMAPVGGREARARATGPLPGVDDRDMGGQFNNKNPGKRGLSLNVRDPRGLDIARRLVAISDIVAEGFSPGVMDRWGLGYDALRAIRPDIIYAQQSGTGSAGTYGRFRAIGPIAASLAGQSEMSGMPEPAPPAGWGYSYLDWIGAYSFGLAMVAALYRRDVTGEGQWIDASQCEAGIFLTGVPVLDWAVNGRAWQRTGNRPPYEAAAPHGIYPASGEDRWIAIACFGEDDWRALAACAGEGWDRDPRFSTLAGRVAEADALDALVAGWTARHDDYELMHRLQGAGVAAGACQTAADRCDRDPQLAHLGWLTEVTGTKIGRWPVAEVPVKLSGTPARVGGVVDRGAPCYGEDNEYVLGELLGMATREIDELARDGVI